MGFLNSFERLSRSLLPCCGQFSHHCSLIIPKPPLGQYGEAFAWGIFLCGLVQLLWVFAPCSLKIKLVLPKRPRLTKDVRTFFHKMIPAALGSGIVQINLFLDMMIGSFLPTRGVSYMGYADRLNQLPLSTIGIAISTALLPLLSKQIRKKQLQAAQYSQTLAIEFALSLAMPAFIGLILLAPFLIENIFQHGQFRPEDVMPTAHTLIAFASGLPAYVLLKVISTSFFAQGDTKNPMIVAGACLTLNVILNLLLIKPLAHVGLALATSLSAWVNLIVLTIILRHKGFFKFDKMLQESLYRIGLVSALFFIFLYTCKAPLMLFLSSISLHRVWLLGSMVTISLGAYLLIAYPLKVLHWKDLKRRLDTDV